MNDEMMRDIIAGLILAVYVGLLAANMPVNQSLSTMAMIAFGYFFKGTGTQGWNSTIIKKKDSEKSQEEAAKGAGAAGAAGPAAAILIFLILMGTSAQADILNPLPNNPAKPYKSFLNSVNGINGNLLADFTQVVNYLGAKEGRAYNFNQRRWVTTSSATLVSYTPWNLGMDINLLNTDGFGGAIDWNLGNFLPVANVPVMQYFQYLSVFGGAGSEADLNKNMKFVSYLGIQFKFTFGPSSGG